MRVGLYFCFLSVFVSVPVWLGLEHAQNYSYATDAIIRAIASMSRFIVAEVTLISEVTPAVVAGAVALLCPRPIPPWIAIITVAIGVVGFLAYAWLGAHAQGDVIFLSSSMLPKIGLALEGNVSREAYQGALQSISDFCRSMRVFYLIVITSTIAFVINPARQEDD